MTTHNHDDDCGVRGGQGRTARDLRESATAFGQFALLAVLLVVVLAIAKQVT